LVATQLFALQPAHFLGVNAVPRGPESDADVIREAWEGSLPAGVGASGSAFEPHRGRDRTITQVARTDHKNYPGNDSAAERKVLTSPGQGCFRGIQFTVIDVGNSRRADCYVQATMLRELALPCAVIVTSTRGREGCTPAAGVR
jgi:hypothetical protein